MDGKEEATGLAVRPFQQPADHVGFSEGPPWAPRFRPEQQAASYPALQLFQSFQLFRLTTVDSATNAS